MLLCNAELALTPRTSADQGAWVLTLPGLGASEQQRRGPGHGHRPGQMPLSKMPQSSNGTTSGNEAGKNKNNLSFRRRIYTGLAHSEAEERKSLFWDSNQQPTLITSGARVHTAWKTNHHHHRAENVIKAALGCRYPVWNRCKSFLSGERHFKQRSLIIPTEKVSRHKKKNKHEK